jgi:hypothetical protein
MQQKVKWKEAKNCLFRFALKQNEKTRSKTQSKNKNYWKPQSKKTLLAFRFEAKQKIEAKRKIIRSETKRKNAVLISLRLKW